MELELKKSWNYKVMILSLHLSLYEKVNNFLKTWKENDDDLL
jgi:hypothetical protein